MRPRFQFRLRTLMIGVTLLAVPCAYVGWQAKIVQERRVLLDSLKAVGGGDVTVLIYNNASPPQPTWLRRILGDETIELLFVPRAANAETMAEIQRLFPDTSVLTRDARGFLIKR